MWPSVVTCDKNFDDVINELGLFLRLAFYIPILFQHLDIYIYSTQISLSCTIISW